MVDKYISLNETKKKLYYIFQSYGISENIKKAIFNAIKKISSADVVPVKYGAWVQTNIFKCSECGYSFEPEGYTAYFNYCPNCGAKMGGKDGENIG